MPDSLETIALDRMHQALIARALSCPNGTVPTRLITSKAPIRALRLHLAAVELQRLGYFLMVGMTPERAHEVEGVMVRCKDCVWELTPKGRTDAPTLMFGTTLDSVAPVLRAIDDVD